MPKSLVLVKAATTQASAPVTLENLAGSQHLIFHGKRPSTAMQHQMHDHGISWSHEPEDMTKAIEHRKGVNPHEGTSKYGHVHFADSVNKKYPLDSAAHVRSAWGYIHHPDDASKYSSSALKTIKDAIRAAAKHFGIAIAEPVRKSLIFVKSGPRPAWHQTRAEFLGNDERDAVTQASPAAIVSAQRSMHPHLGAFAGDLESLKKLLGKGDDTRYDVSQMAPKVARDEKVAIYKMSNGESEITPGATVHLARQGAVDDGVRNGNAQRALLSRDVYPHDLLAHASSSASGYLYAPRDMAQHHEESVMAAAQRGENVPAHVQSDYVDP